MAMPEGYLSVTLKVNFISLSLPMTKEKTYLDTIIREREFFPVLLDSVHLQSSSQQPGEKLWISRYTAYMIAVPTGKCNKSKRS